MKHFWKNAKAGFNEKDDVPNRNEMSRSRSPNRGQSYGNWNSSNSNRYREPIRTEFTNSNYQNDNKQFSYNAYQNVDHSSSNINNWNRNISYTNNYSNSSNQYNRNISNVERNNNVYQSAVNTQNYQNQHCLNNTFNSTGHGQRTELTNEVSNNNYIRNKDFAKINSISN